jgi:hypothetical protein
MQFPLPTLDAKLKGVIFPQTHIQRSKVFLLGVVEALTKLPPIEATWPVSLHVDRTLALEPFIEALHLVNNMQCNVIIDEDAVLVSLKQQYNIVFINLSRKLINEKPYFDARNVVNRRIKEHTDLNDKELLALVNSNLMFSKQDETGKFIISGSDVVAVPFHRFAALKHANVSTK